MVSLEEWKPTTSLVSGFAASGRLPPGSVSHHRRPRRAGGLPADHRGESRQGRGPQDPTRSTPAAIGGARAAPETADGAGRTGRPPRLAESSAIREGLSEPSRWDGSAPVSRLRDLP